MLESCFIHLPGVGPAFDAKLRKAGIETWEDALSKPLPCGCERGGQLLAAIAESRERLASGDAAWFSRQLPPREQWRLFPHFRHSAAYVDIETTGLSWNESHITTIALFDGSSVRTYVYGDNLEAFADDILAYSLLVTWNGRGFDAPILRRALHIPLDQGDMGHLDLLPVFRALDLRGGLKAVEKKLGLDREELDGVDGWAAVRLWAEYERSGDPAALDTLLAYNVADVLSLEVLAEYAVRRLDNDAAVSPAPVSPVRSHLNPFSPDKKILRKLGLGA